MVAMVAMVDIGILEEDTEGLVTVITAVLMPVPAVMVALLEEAAVDMVQMVQQALQDRQEQ